MGKKNRKNILNKPGVNGDITHNEHVPTKDNTPTGIHNKLKVIQLYYILFINTI